jgi:hypothetical protein
MKTTMRLFFLIFPIFLILASCSLFETRTPEPPDGGSSQFIPPTSPYIVIDNFIEAVKTKNIENYISCFAQTGYSFIPSGDVAAKFPSLFDNWEPSSERSYLLSLASILGQSNDIHLVFESRDFETISSDSAILITNYFINYNLQNTNHPTQYEGRAAFTLIPVQSGLWAISKWQDYSMPSSNDKDSTNETWSNLKAYFYN